MLIESIGLLPLLTMVISVLVETHAFHLVDGLNQCFHGISFYSEESFLYL